MRRTLLFLVLAVAVAATANPPQRDGFKRYRDENDAKQAALEGKAPPAIVASEWVNSRALTWKSLKGKVVLVDLWAYW